MDDVEGRVPSPPGGRGAAGLRGLWAFAERCRDDQVLRTVVLVVAMLVAGGGYLGWRAVQPRPPAVEDVLPRVSLSPTSAPTTTAAPVVVHVVGAVARPGVQQLPAGSRVLDAVDAAGGATEGADLSQLNLAAPVVDGAQVRVPLAGEPASGPLVVGPAPAADAGGGASGAPVALNSADAAQLEALPGVGPATAAAIVAWREANGPFATVDQLLEVRGIGPAKLDAIRDLVVVR